MYVSKLSVKFYYHMQAYVGKREGLYAKTKRNGYLSAILSLLNLLYTGCVTMLIIGLLIGIRCGTDTPHY